MKTLTIKQDAINVTALDENIRYALGNNYLGLSFHTGEVRVHLVDNTSSEQVQQVEQLVRDHNPAVLTAKQQEEQAYEQRLKEYRAADTLDLSDYEGASVEMQTLAQKIAWLELEIRELRGL